MFGKIAYFNILGLPLIVYLGILTLLLFIFTAFIAVMNKRGNHSIPFVWHSRMAKIAITLALIHGLLAVLSYF